MAYGGDDLLPLIVGGAANLEHRPPAEAEDRDAAISGLGLAAGPAGPLIDYVATVEAAREGRPVDAALSGAESVSGTAEMVLESGAARGTALAASGSAVGMSVASVGVSLLCWFLKGMALLGEAHEKGDRDARIAIYARAFADGFLTGRHQNLGAAADQVEAMQLGLADGRAAAGSLGAQAAEVARGLLSRYGDEDNVTRALTDELLHQAGIDVTTHREPSARGNR